MIPYIYIIKYKPGNMYYLGCQYGNNCHPDNLWSTYFTSSKVIQHYVKWTGKDSFEVKVLKTFDFTSYFLQLQEKHGIILTSKDKNKLIKDLVLSCESKYLRRLKAKERSDFFNLTDGTELYT